MRAASASLEEGVLAYLRERNVMTLATAGPEGVWAAAVFYANEGPILYFLSSPATRHARNVAAHPRVAATIQADYAGWPEIKGIQLEGIATPLTGGEAEHARAIYGTKFPIVRALPDAPAALVAALAKVRWYRLVPDRLYFIDNSAGFGHRDEIDCGRLAAARRLV